MRFDLARRRRPGSLGTGGIIVGTLLLAGVWAGIRLDLEPADLVPGKGGLRLAGDFLGHALRPALAFQGEWSDGSRWGVLAQAGRGALWTVAFAGAAISLALPGGLVLGILGASSWWPDGRGAWLTVPARAVAALLRSIHELIWAVLLLAALGTDPLVAVVAIALPYTGILAKVFAEMIDEAPRPAAAALVQAGASPLQGFFWGVLPRAAPDLLAYTFYRFECALRSSAVLGFFGFPTLGFYLAASFENLHYGEVWTYLYVLFGLVALGDWWSGRIRQEAAA